MYTLETARHEANINARAARLFTTEGYTFSAVRAYLHTYQAESKADAKAAKRERKAKPK